MRLILQGWRIALRRSIGSVCCIIACLMLLTAVVSVILKTEPQPEPVNIAVICQDDSPLVISIITSVVDSRFEGLVTITLLQDIAKAKDYSAILTLPEGFWDSIMTGENLSPTLAINVSSPLEGLWVRQLAESAARTLSHSQNAMGGIFASMHYDGLSYDEISNKMFAADLALMESYIDHKSDFKSKTLLTTGNVSAIQYYGGSAVSFVIFMLMFMLFKPLYELRQFSSFSNRRSETFASCLLTSLTLSLLMCSLGVFALSAEPKNILSGNSILLILLTASLLTACAATFNSAASCAAAVSGFAMLQALFGGGLLPESLLPPSFGVLCRVLPLSLMRRLFTAAAFRSDFSDAVLVLIWCALLLLGSRLLWNRKGAA